MEQSSLAVNQFRQAMPSTDKVTSFELLLNEWEIGWLRIPDHQREPDAWSDKKAAKYVACLLKGLTEGSQPTGCFVTYQIVLDDHEVSPAYLNDGYQRLTTLRNLKRDPGRFGMDDEGVAHVLRQDATVQHRHFRSHVQAMENFQLINNGTALTPYELCRGYLIYMPDYDAKWASLLESVENIVAQSWTRVGASRKGGREKAHKLRRHTLALFHRHISRHCGTSASTYGDVVRKNVLELAEAGDVIEVRLTKVLLTLGAAESAKETKRFVGLIDRETAHLEERLVAILGQGAALSEVCHRWLLEFAIWCKVAGVPVHTQTAFVDEALRGTGGGSQWPRGDAGVTTLQLSGLGDLLTLAEHVGMPELVQGRQRRRASKPTRPGYHTSHELPFVTNGDGPTFPEAASVNMARGAKPVEKEKATMKPPTASTQGGGA